MRQHCFTRLLAIIFSLFPLLLSAQSNTTICENIQIQTVDNKLIVNGLDLANVKARIYNDAYELVLECAFDCAIEISVADVFVGEVYHLTFEFFTDDFDFIKQDNRDYTIGSSALNISLCTETVKLYTQAEVDAFCGCEIALDGVEVGDRFIAQLSDVSDISNLSGIKAIGESLLVYNTNLTNLAALSDLFVSRSIAIIGNPQLEEIGAFQQVEELDGLNIVSNSNLSQINGFQALTKLTNVLSINNNPSLTALNAFNNLTTTNIFQFENNDAFVNLTDFENLTTIANNFTISDNDALEIIEIPNLTGDIIHVRIANHLNLKQLPTIGGFTISSLLQIVNNPMLETCCELFTLFDNDLNNGQNRGLLDLKDNGDLCNSTLTILENCGGMSPINCDAITLESENNNLIIKEINAPIAIIKVYDESYQTVFECSNNCAETISISDLNTCETYTADVQLYSENFELICERKFSSMVNGTPEGNPVCQGDIILASQADVDNFCGCSTIEGSLYIGFQEANNITNISNLSTISEVTDFVSITQTQLSNLSDLTIKKVGRSLMIENNSLLEDITAFNELELGEWLTIQRNTNLKDISGFQQVDNLQTVTIALNVNLNTISGFGNLRSTYGLNLLDNPVLLEITAFKHLENSTSQIVIRNNESLQKIAFPALKTTAILIVEENANLTTVDDFDEPNISFLLQVQKNVTLTDCCFLADLVDEDFSNGFVGGDIRIRDNGEMCNTIAEILSNCRSNPVGCESIEIATENNQLVISGINAPNAIVKIFDQTWQLVFDCNANCEEAITLDNLNAGDIYHTDIQFYDANWQFICEDRQDIEIQGGGDPNPFFSCDNIKVSYANNDLTISGLTAPIEIVKIFDKDWQLLFECFADCEEIIALSNVNSAIFRIQISAYDEDWHFLCHADQDLIPAGSRTLNKLVPKDFSLYPNPAYEAVYLDLKPLEGTEVTLSILNQFGQKIYEKRIEKVVNEPEKVDISNFSNGLYFLQIKGENRKLIGKRLIVNRLY